MSSRTVGAPIRRRDLDPVVADRPQSVDGHHAERVGDRAAGDDRDVRVGHRDELGENAPRFVGNDCVDRPRRDRRQRAVDVEQQQQRTAGESPRERRRQRQCRCRHVVTRSPRSRRLVTLASRVP